MLFSKYINSLQLCVSEGLTLATVFNTFNNLYYYLYHFKYCLNFYQSLIFAWYLCPLGLHTPPFLTICKFFFRESAYTVGHTQSSFFSICFFVWVSSSCSLHLCWLYLFAVQAEQFNACASPEGGITRVFQVSGFADF